MKTRKLLLLGWLLTLTIGTHAKGHTYNNKVVVAYVTSWTQVIPDPTVMTHLNYAFGHVSETFDGVGIANESRLRQMVALKKQCPQLKVLLSIGGWGSGRFSEMAASDTNRAAFARDCKRVVDTYQLDGIDIDWEYPTQSSAGISSSPDDTEHFTLLMRDIRKAIGKKKLLTCATVASAQYVDFKSCIQYLDWVNVMSYDMANAPKHHSALYPSDIAGWMTGAGAVDAHLKAGVPASKLVMGMPFYGRGEVRDYHKRRHEYAKTYTEHWDEQAQVPYLTDGEGKMVLGFENTRSLGVKCQYILDRGLLGGMYWEYGDDTWQGDERQTLCLSLLKNQKATLPPKKVLVMAERGTGHEGFVVAAAAWLDSVALAHNLQLTYVSTMNDVRQGELDHYHLILQLNYPPYAWSQEAQHDFERYIDEGHGGYIGFHHATLLGDIFDGYTMWQWFSDFMGSIRFQSYIAPLADGTVCVEDTGHPVMKGLPPTFVIPKDEWYTYHRNPRPNVHVLAHVDEASYQPASDIRMGDHPVIWTQEQKGARNVYFQIGHHADLLRSEAFKKMFENAIRWTLFEE